MEKAVRQRLLILRRTCAGALMLAVACAGLFGEHAAAGGEPAAAGEAPAPAKSRGLRVQIQSSEAADARSLGETQMYTASYALVIGIDQYTNGWQKLSNAVKDARKVGLALEEQGFEVQYEANLGSEDLNRVLRRFFILKGAEPNARLLLWYAGHGHTIKGEGFLVPADAPVGEDFDFKLKAIHMRDFGSYVRLAESKHVLAIFDSCFSGTIFAASRGRPPAAITRATSYPVRQFLTSGDADQVVSDDGVFRELFVDSLLGRERADLNQDGYITGSEIGMFLTDRITNLTRGMQTPRYGTLRDKDFDRGDFVLSVIRPAKPAPLRPASAAPAEPKGIQDERLFWESIRKWDDLRGYRAYLDKYPDGVFAPLARIQLERPGPNDAEPLRPTVTPLSQQRWTATAANVRAEPTVGAPRVGGLSQGAPAHVTGQAKVEGETWYRVQLPGGLEGFVLGRLLVAEAELAANAGRPPLPDAKSQTAEGANVPHASPTYTERIEAARMGRHRKREEQIADMIQDQALQSLEQGKCRRSCESTSFRYRVEKQPNWPTARGRCEVALPDHQAYDQCVDQQRGQFEQRLRSDCMQNC